MNKKLKVAFPHMGSIYIVWASIINSLGGEAVIPPYTSKRTLSLGTKYSPEAICLPYKLLLGNYIEAIEGGANTIVMLVSPGICRLGEYHRSIVCSLKELGYKANFWEIDLYKGKLSEMYKILSKTSGNKNPFAIIKALYIGLRKVFVLDKLEDTLSYYRAREIKQGEAEKAFNKGVKTLLTAYNVKDLKEAEKKAIEDIKNTPIDENREVLHVDITGEIFLVLDYFSNQNIERELGKLGVEVRRCLNVSGWVKTAIFPRWMRKDETHIEKAWKYAKPYLTRDIGGDALEVIGDVHYANETGVDGIVHISPFTCMPEIMSQNIFPAMREDCEIPILPLIMDEQTGKAGFVTRLEAFVDLMRRRKRRQQLQPPVSV